MVREIRHDAAVVHHVFLQPVDPGVDPVVARTYCWMRMLLSRSVSRKGTGSHSWIACISPCSFSDFESPVLFIYLPMQYRLVLDRMNMSPSLTAGVPLKPLLSNVRSFFATTSNLSPVLMM